jgi:hypothetical protein
MTTHSPDRTSARANRLCSLVTNGLSRQVILEPIHIPPLGVHSLKPNTSSSVPSLRRMMELSGDILEERQRRGNLRMDPFFPNLRTSVRR